MNPLIQVDRVTFGYHGGMPLLSSWSAEFLAGEMTAIVGPSGRGKSTLLYILGLMLKPKSGVVLLDGASASDLSDRDRAHLRASEFGFVFQDAALDASRTVVDNILESSLYRGDRRQPLIRRAIELMEQFGVDVRADAKPGQISGGQAQRIALCRSLLADPRILLADEPTGNLDRASADVVLGALREQAQRGATVIVVTHDPALVDYCDRKIEL